MEKLLFLSDNPVKSIGVANFNSKQIQEILDQCHVVPAVNQVECHPYFNQKKLKAFLDRVLLLLHSLKVNYMVKKRATYFCTY